MRQQYPTFNNYFQYSYKTTFTLFPFKPIFGHIPCWYFISKFKSHRDHPKLHTQHTHTHKKTLSAIQTVFKQNFGIYIYLSIHINSESIWDHIALLQPHIFRQTANPKSKHTCTLVYREQNPTIDNLVVAISPPCANRTPHFTRYHPHTTHSPLPNATSTPTQLLYSMFHKYTYIYIYVRSLSVLDVLASRRPPALACAIRVDLCLAREIKNTFGTPVTDPHLHTHTHKNHPTPTKRLAKSPQSVAHGVIITVPPSAIVSKRKGLGI